MTEQEAKLEQIEERLDKHGWLSPALTADDMRWLCNELRKTLGIQVCSECGTLKLGLHGICAKCIEEWKASDDCSEVLGKAQARLPWRTDGEIK